MYASVPKLFRSNCIVLQSFVFVDDSLCTVTDLQVFTSLKKMFVQKAVLFFFFAIFEPA